MKIIYKARDIIEAHIVSGMLNANGIETHVGGYYLQGGVGDLAAFDFANVQVADKDVTQALPLVAEYEGAQELDAEYTRINPDDEGHAIG
ncbi:MAG TPA: DUF2007 domain-containing protein [Gammaproteobacteria bacterium]|nr:DUF2007 domain-containing protein [Gammaproteobacteria bacterium]